MMKLWLRLSVLVLLCEPTLAGVVMGGTRVIYPQGKREVAFSVTNMDKQTPYLIQSWLETQTGERDGVPFIVTPPLFRLDPEQKNVLRISYMGTALPADRESLFWLNVKNIAPSQKEQTNKLQINVKSKFKLFYRPQGLVGDPVEAYANIKFNCAQNKLIAHNPTPYFVSFYAIRVGKYNVAEPGMIAPYSDQQWPVTCGGRIRWQAITDFGGITPIAHQA
ncbi:MAG: fimbrial biogenesis chaperone [Aeromonadaceae bacterium]